jgi:MATE family multidrug resistance protein
MSLDRQSRREFVRLTSLNILSNISVPLASLADTAMLGRLPDIRFLAGVALAGVLFDYLYWSFGFLRMGTTGITALAEGRGDRDELAAVLHRAMLTSALIATAVLLLRRPLADIGFALLGGSVDVEAAGRSYFDIRIWAAPAVLTNFACVGWLLGRGRSGQVLCVTVLASLSNIGFNYWFIVHLRWDAFGAGLGTMLSQYLMLAANVLLIGRYGRLGRIDWPRILDLDRIGALARLNLDLLVRTFCLLTAFALFTSASARISTTLLAANTILLRLLTFAAYWIDGAAFATETYTGRLTGRRDRDGLVELLRLALGTGLAFAIVFLATLVVAPGPILGLLTSHDALVLEALRYAPWLAATLLLGSVAYVLDGFFLGMASGRTLRNAMILSLLIAVVPLGIVAYRSGSNHLLWTAMTVFMAARAATLGLAVPSALPAPEPERP